MGTRGGGGAGGAGAPRSGCEMCEVDVGPRVGRSKLNRARGNDALMLFRCSPAPTSKQSGDVHSQAGSGVPPHLRWVTNQALRQCCSLGAAQCSECGLGVFGQNVQFPKNAFAESLTDDCARGPSSHASPGAATEKVVIQRLGGTACRNACTQRRHHSRAHRLG